MDYRPKYVVAPSRRDVLLSIMQAPEQLGRTSCGSGGANHVLSCLKHGNSCSFDPEPSRNGTHEEDCDSTSSFLD